MSNVKNFFKEKKDWSIYKDALLKSYLVPYFTKLLSTRRDIVFIDGFAGKGKFEDGTVGSPLIVKEAIYTALNMTKYNSQIIPYFVDYSYASELKSNLHDKTMNVISGDYRVEVPKILSSVRNKNVFLYVDPFGIKYLDFSIFKNLNNIQANSYELLLNLNSFGFIREGCRLLKYHFDGDDDLPDYEYEADSFKNSIENMNRVAGGRYWQQIITDYNAGRYDIFIAEDLFLEKYIEQLKKIFTYVFQVPIKKGGGRLAKYRMIFASNHPHGALLMVDDMVDCNNKIQKDSHGQQMWLFDYDYEKQNCSADLWPYITDGYQDLTDVYIRFYEKEGIKYYTKDLKEAIKKMEREKTIEVARSPAYTSKGRTATSLDYTKYKIKVRKKK